MGKGLIFHFMLHQGCQGSFQIIRDFDACADRETALGVSINQQDTLSSMSKADAEVECCGRLANTALLIGDGNNLCVHFFTFLQ